MALQWRPGCGHQLVTMCSGVMPGRQCWWVGVLRVQRVGDSQPPSPSGSIMSYGIHNFISSCFWGTWGFPGGAFGAPLWTPAACHLQGGCREAMSVAMQTGGRMEMEGCAAEPLEGELQLQSLPLHCSLARTGPGKWRCSSRLNFDPLGN